MTQQYNPPPREMEGLLAAQCIDIPPASGDFKVDQPVFAVDSSRLRRPAGLKGSIEHTLPERTGVTVAGPAVLRDNLHW